MEPRDFSFVEGSVGGGTGRPIIGGTPRPPTHPRRLEALPPPSAFPGPGEDGTARREASRSSEAAARQAGRLIGWLSGAAGEATPAAAAGRKERASERESEGGRLQPARPPAPLAGWLSVCLAGWLRAFAFPSLPAHPPTHRWRRPDSQPVAGVGREGGQDEEQQRAQEVARAHPGRRPLPLQAGRQPGPGPPPAQPQVPPPPPPPPPPRGRAAGLMRRRQLLCRTVSSAGRSRDGAAGGRAGRGPRRRLSGRAGDTPEAERQALGSRLASPRLAPAGLGAPPAAARLPWRGARPGPARPLTLEESLARGGFAGGEGAPRIAARVDGVSLG